MTITSQKTKSRHNTVQGACPILSSGSHASWRSIHFKNKKCSKCKQFKQLPGFRKDRTAKDGIHGHCKACELIIKRKYQRTDKGKANHQARKKRFNARYPNKLKAVNAVNSAITAGRLTRPDTLFCYYCPVQAEQYHHYLGYEPEHWFDIVPVCIKCHRQIHKKIA